MAPKNPKNPKKDDNKGNNLGKVGKAKPGKGGVVSKSALVTPPPNIPTEQFPVDTQPLDLKKWCVKDTYAFQPTVEKWYFKGDQKIQIPGSVPSSCPLKRNTIVDVLPQDNSISWSAIVYEETIYGIIDDKTGKKDWVTTRFTGWVDNNHLDNYIEEFPDSEVGIPHATKKSNDLEQDMTIEDEGYDEIRARYNMCGELCVAFVVKEEFDSQISIDDVLKKWKNSGVKNKAGQNVNYASLVGKGRDETLVAKHLKEILALYYTDDVSKKIESYTETLPGKIPLTNLGNDPHDDRHASDAFQDKLLRCYFITLVTINPNTGELIPNPEPAKRNHWVIVDRISRNGVRVEIYNPSPNKRQSYSFREFSSSVGSNPNTGWWVERKRPRKRDDFDIPKEVAIENPTPDEKDAEQYMLVDRLKKTNLCGEFSVAYILKGSLDKALKRWFDRQVVLKKMENKIAGIWELAAVIQAFGLNAIKEGVHSYSIDRVLTYWKAIQPDLYTSILGSTNNETTGVDDLITILKAYGYDSKKGDYMYGGLASSPGESADKLKAYYLIAGVRIDTGKKGRLKNKLGDGVDHWVVLNKISPVETLVGGNGGWVELYNSFTNVLEEYSYKEFMESFSGVGLWVTRDVDPFFTWQYRVPAKVKSGTKGKTGGKSKVIVNKVSEGNLRKEIQKAKDKGTTSLGAIADMLSNPKLKLGWSRQEIFKLLKNPEVTSTRKSLTEVERLLCENLGIGSIAREISRWIRDESDGNLSFAVELATMLREFGVLVIENNTSSKIIKPEDPPISIEDKRGRVVNLKDLNLSEDKNLSDVLQTALASRFSSTTPSSQLARKVAGAFTDQAIEQISKYPPTIQAYKSWADYVKWEATIAVPESKMYRVRRWGDRVMKPLKFDTNLVGGNFQAVGLYNKETGFGAVTNYIHILRDDIDQLIDMQFDQTVDGKKYPIEDKMSWLCQYKEKIYMFDHFKDSWQKSERIRWGTLALGGNLVQVIGEDMIDIRLPGEDGKGKVAPRRMMRLAGFRKKDWSRPLDELLAEGLVHRCFVANGDNSFADTTKGIVYSPFYSMLDWEFNNGTANPDALYIPFEYLEPRPDPKLEGKPEVEFES